MAKARQKKNTGGPVDWNTWQSSMVWNGNNTGARTDRAAYDNYASHYNNTADDEYRKQLNAQHGFGSTSPTPAAAPLPAGTAHTGETRSSISAPPPATVEKIEPGPPSEIFQMDDVGDATANTATASIATAAQTGETSTAPQADPLTAHTMDPSLVDQAATATAAEGEVTNVAEVDEGTLTELAGAAQRDTQAELESLSQTPEFIESQEALAVAEVDEQPVEAQAAIAELPVEALVTTQLDNLLEGLENDEIPPWARPAVDRVMAMMRSRGIDTSTVARDALFNAIIQSAVPLAQSNAQALQQRASQNLGNQQQANMLNAQLESDLKITNLSNKQQASMFNAAQQGNIDLTKFSAEQQTALANSNFAQTMTATDFSARQQSIIQNATALASMDMANLDVRTRLAVENAKSFLQMDLTNLSNEQQTAIVNQQSEQQALLSNQSAQNVARQFNAASQNQVDQFMTSLAANINQFNSTQLNSMQQFNVAEQNRINGLNAQNGTQVSLANAQMLNQVEQFNLTLDQATEQWNTANQQAVSQADTTWNRQVNTINTAAVNAANTLHTQQLFEMSRIDLLAYRQAIRDSFNFAFQSSEGQLNRETELQLAGIQYNPQSTSSGTNWTGFLLDNIVAPSISSALFPSPSSSDD